MVLLVDFLGRRSFAPVVKSSSLKLLCDLVRQSVTWGGLPIFGGAISVTVVADHGAPENLTLNFSAAGFTKDLCNLATTHAASARAWKQLTETPWHDRKITSTLDLASIWDLLFFVAWSKHNPSRSRIWVDFCQQLYPRMVFVCGFVMDRLASHLACRDAAPLPLLKTSKGNTRRIPKVNKFLLLKRLREQRRHRQEVMKTHTDLTSSHAGLVLHEQLITVCNYLKNVFECFKDCTQIAVSWDGSCYDVETLVLLAYSHESDTCGYLPLQQMGPVQTDELEESIQKLAFEGRATRVEGYGTMRALSHALSFVGLPLQTFEVPSDLHLAPLQSEEVRYVEDGVFYIRNEKTGQTKRQVPEGLDVSRLPV